MSKDELKAKVLRAIDARMPEFERLLGDVVRIPTDNPPGDTTACVTFLADYLKANGLPADVYEPQPTLQSLVSYKTGAESGRNLVLNGHLDQFPAGDSKDWSFDPYSGECRDGRILGRGVGDMKAGSVASLICLLLIHELEIPIKGQLTLTLVGDEEAGSKWGVQWLLENVPSTRGDACLNSEPTCIDQVLIGHRGMYWLEVKTRHAGGWAGLPAADDAISKAMIVAEAVKKLHGWKATPPPEMAAAIERAKAKLEEQPSTRGTSWIVDSTTVNVGTIQGGVQPNTIAAHCSMRIDVRPPIGITTAQVEARVEEVVRETGLNMEEISLEWILAFEASYSSPEDEIVRLTVANAHAITGLEIEANASAGSTDTRLWWRRGIPAVVYGTNAPNVAAPDEWVSATEFRDVIKVHAATVVDYLCD
jgi:succinyl-diaminopimelate desuccinylase